tara:strand:- start:1773 stop:2255 length:483 start_codon:yes stop_codon:yes gene_type:complete
MSQNYRLVEVTPTVNTAEYAVGDCIFVSTEIENFFRTKNDAAEIKSLTVIDRSVDAPAMYVYLTTNATTLGSINATADGADAVVDDVQCIIPVVAADFLGGANFTDTCGVACITDPANDGIGCIVSSKGSSSLYICAILAAGAETFAVGDLTFKIGLKYI